MFRAITVLMAFCSAAAVAIRLILSILTSICPTALIASVGAMCIAAFSPAMSSVARAVSGASDVATEATTAKPLPAPAVRAASIVAFAANRPA